MATGIGNLPYQDLDVVPFTPIVSAWGDAVAADILALADASGIGDGAITSDKIDWATVYVDTSFDTGWIDVSFQNSYSNQSSTTTSYRKIANIVYLRGQPGKGTLDSSVIFTLPLEFRPAITSIYIVPSTSSNVAKCVVGANGNVNIGTVGSAGTYVGLDGVSFVV